MTRAIRSDGQTDMEATERPWARAWISNSYIREEQIGQISRLYPLRGVNPDENIMLPLRLARRLSRISLEANERGVRSPKRTRAAWTLCKRLYGKASDWPGSEATSGGLRVPAFSVCTPAPWLSAAPAVAFGCSPPRPSEWSPYSSACLWGRRKTKVHSQSQLTFWPAAGSSKGFFMALKPPKRHGFKLSNVQLQSGLFQKGLTDHSIWGWGSPALWCDR